MAGKKSGARNVSKTSRSRTAAKLTPTQAETLKALRDSQSQLKAALRAAHMGTWELNLKTNKVKWSENVPDIFGLTATSFDGTLSGYMLYVVEEDREPLLIAIQEAIDKKHKFISQHRIRWPDGSVHWIEGIGKLVSNKKGIPIKLAGSVQDITPIQLSAIERDDWKIRYELIAISSGQVIYDYDLVTRKIVWSGLVTEVLGYTALEMENQEKSIELIHPEDIDRVLRDFAIAREGITSYDTRYRLRKKNGVYIHVHNKGFFLGGHGKANRMLGVMQDITDRVKAEETIEQSNRFKESVENAMPGMLYVYDLEHDISVYTNQNTKKILGYSPAEITHMGAEFNTRVTHPDDIKKFPEWTNEGDDVVKETQYRMRTKSGDWRWFISRDTVFKRDQNGKVTHIIGIAQDITERKQSEELLHARERSYHELFDTVGEAIYIMNLDSTFVDVNKGACEMCGYEKEEFIGRTPDFFSVKEKNAPNLIIDSIQKSQGGSPLSFEWWARKKNGTVFVKEVRMNRGTYFGKEIIIATARDMTGHRESVQALKESEQRFRTLQQASFGGIGLHDHGVIIDCNQGLCDLTGYAYEELVGRNGIDLIAPEWREVVVEHIQSNYEKPYDVEGIRKDGSRFFLEIHGKQIPYQGRSIRVTEFRDVTERKRAEEKILEQNARLLAITEELKRKNEQLEEFTQIVSHNLRSPVGNILTLLNFLEGAATAGEREEYISYLKESGNLILTTLHELNEVLKIKQSQNIEKQQLIFQHVFDHVRAMLIAQIAETQADIVVDFSAAPTILYPNIYLESIFLNLLSNSLKYFHPDRKPLIRMRTYRTERDVVLEVSDNGLGIDLKRYGHQVFRLRKTFHRHPESRGIGLFMIKNQIEAMGGEISVSSIENEGTTFLVNFNKHQHDGE